MAKLQRSQIVVTDSNALIPQDSGHMVFQKFSITPVGVAIPEDVTEDDLIALRDFYYQIEVSIQWVVGDLANSLKTFKGDGVYEDLAVRFNKSPKTIREWAYVCGSVPLSIRMDKPITFKHHQVVAPLPIDDQRRWLEQAMLTKLSSEQLREQILLESGQAIPDQPKPIMARINREFQIHHKQIITMDKEQRSELRQLLLELLSKIDAIEKQPVKLLKVSATPKLRQWYGDPLKPPKIRTVKSLRGNISPKVFTSVIWIAKIRPQDNVIIESYPLKSWHFATDGRLIGKVDTGHWKKDVEIALNEYVILHVK